MSTVSFVGSNRSLHVGKILCLGRNYPAHAREMHAEIPKTPVVFLKPATAILAPGGEVVIPPISREMHYEAELVVVIGQEGRSIPRQDAFGHVAGYAVGLDMTLRDLQSEAKKQGLPWAVAKGFDTSAPLSPAVERHEVSDPHALTLTLRVNGIIRQQASTASMLFRIDEVISYLSTVFTLEPGDLVFTGTPEGVGQAVPGDVLEASLDKVGTLRVSVRAGAATTTSP